MRSTRRARWRRACPSSTPTRSWISFSSSKPEKPRRSRRTSSGSRARSRSASIGSRVTTRPPSGHEERNTMRAAILKKYDQPWSLESLPEPRPAEGQVLIRIRASGMCGTDLHVHHGKIPVTLPKVLGHEPIGEIIGLGPGVLGLRTGDRVGVSWSQRGCGRCRFCQEDRSKYCAEAQTWKDLGGGNSELMLAWATGCTLVPKALSDAEAAPIFCAGFTVVSGLRNAAPRPGDRVAVLGVGGLGHLAIQYARALGLEVFALTGTAGKRDEARRLGADEV